jgi:hypothetical protein
MKVSKKELVRYIMSRKKKSKNNNVEKWIGEQYEEYLSGLYGMGYITGFTEGGIPYGIFEEDIEQYEISTPNNNSNNDNEIPF